MSRPKLPRICKCNPCSCHFKPQGVPMRLLEEVILLPDEFEAIKLYEVDEFSQIQASEKMNISQPTFARILASANKKIAEALVKGKAIKIEDGISYK